MLTSKYFVSLFCMSVTYLILPHSHWTCLLTELSLFTPPLGRQLSRLRQRGSSCKQTGRTAPWIVSRVRSRAAGPFLPSWFLPRLVWGCPRRCWTAAGRLPGCFESKRGKLGGGTWASIHAVLPQCSGCKDAQRLRSAESEGAWILLSTLS